MKVLDKIKNLWVIDDDDIFHFAVRKHLEMEKLSLNIKGFTHGEEALYALLDMQPDDENFPDMILLDINMPVMDGWEFAEEYDKKCDPTTKKVPVIMISSSVHNSDVSRVAEFSNVLSYVTKPVTREKLLLSIETAGGYHA